MPFESEKLKVTQSELDTNGVFGMPDIPGLSATEMQRKFDALASFIAMKKYNALLAALADEDSGTLTAAEIRGLIDKAVFSSGAADMQRYIYDPAGHERDVFAYADAKISALYDVPAAEFWVSPDGDDSATGTALSPFRSIRRAISALPKFSDAARTVRVAEGDYTSEGVIDFSGFFGKGQTRVIGAQSLAEAASHKIDCIAATANASPIVIRGLSANGVSGGAFELTGNVMAALDFCAAVKSPAAADSRRAFHCSRGGTAVLNFCSQSNFGGGYTASFGGNMVIQNSSSASVAGAHAAAESGGRIALVTALNVSGSGTPYSASGGGVITMP